MVPARQGTLARAQGTRARTANTQAAGVFVARRQEHAVLLLAVHDLTRRFSERLSKICSQEWQRVVRGRCVYMRARAWHACGGRIGWMNMHTSTNNSLQPPHHWPNNTRARKAIALRVAGIHRAHTHTHIHADADARTSTSTYANSQET